MQLSLNVLKFQDIRNQIIKFYTENSPYSIKNGGQFDFASSNLSYFIDAMSYAAMMEGFNNSNIANNVFLDTTELRKNGVSKAKELTYTPKRPQSSKISGKLTYNGINFNENSKLTIYSRSPFQGSFGNIYYNMEPIELVYNGDPTQLEGEYLISQGNFEYTTVYSDGSSNFNFTIYNTNIAEENFSLYVVPQSVAELYGVVDNPQNINHLLEYKWNLVEQFNDILSPNSYFIEEDITNEGCPKIVFNDTNLSNIPSNTDVIICEFFTTKGSTGNNENLVSLPLAITESGLPNTYIYYDISKLSIGNNFSIDNFDSTVYQNIYNKSYGGNDLETLDSIKINAPRTYVANGKIVTTPNYKAYLSNISGIGSFSVIGGEELYPNEDKAGNIYISVAPEIEASEFLNKNNIYVSKNIENSIKQELVDRSIISTPKHFIKPVYILVDVFPLVELDSNTSFSSINTIKKQIKVLVENYFNSKYNSMNVPFKGNSITTIDNLDYVKSYNLDYKYSFVINNEVIDNLSSTNNTIFLPVVNVKNSLGEIVETHNFIKTNKEIIQTELYPNEDWNLLNKSYDSLSNIDKQIYQLKSELYNQYMNNLSPKNSSLYSDNGGLINDSLNRFLYNSDMINFKIMDVVVSNTEPFFKTYGYIDNFGRSISVNVSKNVNSITLNFSYVYNNIYIDKQVATINFDSNNNLYFSDIQKELLHNYFNIDDSKYQFYGHNYDKIPFNIIKNLDNTISVEMVVNTYNTHLKLYTRNDLFNVTTANSITATNINTKLSNWTFENIDTTYSKIKYNGQEVAVVELNNNSFFRGFIDNTTFTSLVLSNYTQGDYFIFTDIVYDKVNQVYYYPNDVAYVHIINNTLTLSKSEVKRVISSNSTILNTLYSQGDIYSSTSSPSGFVVYDINNGFANIQSVNLTVDGSQLLPKPLTNNHIVRTIVDNSHNTTGVNVYYPNTYTNKISTLYKMNQDLSWSSIPSTVFDGDLIIYNYDYTRLNGVGWYLLDNTNSSIKSKCSAITINAGGVGYNNSEVVTLQDTNGNVVNGMLNVFYKCETVHVSGGSGYVAGESITLRNTYGVDVTGVIDVEYKCLSLNITNGGSGYTSGSAILTNGTNDISCTIGCSGGIINTVTLGSSDYGFHILSEALTIKSGGGSGTGASFAVGSIGEGRIKIFAVSNSAWGFNANEALTPIYYTGAGTGASFSVSSVNAGTIGSINIISSDYGFYVNSGLIVSSYLGVGTGASFEVASVVEYFSSDRVAVHPEFTSDVSSLPSEPYLFQTYKISSDIDITNYLSLFVNPPSDNHLYIGNYIIFDGNGWKIFNDDFYDYQIDVVNTYSQFPIPLMNGWAFDVVLPSAPTSNNFEGETNLVTYSSGDKIVFIGGNDFQWKKLSYVGVLPVSTASANIGDMIEVSEDCNLNNDSRISAPLYNGNMLFKSGDRLIYNGSSWYKVSPSTVYTTNNLMNYIGFNSDIQVEQTTTNTFTIYLTDIYHNSSIGELDYQTGILTLNSNIDKTLNKKSVNKSSTPLSTIFKYENYNNSDLQMDVVRFKPVQIEFDTTFNQYIITNVHEVSNI
jgi:hypothetical protein